MRRHIILAIITLALIQHSNAQINTVYSLEWNPAILTGKKAGEFISAHSTRGFTFNAYAFFTENISVGAGVGFNGFFEKSERQTYQLGDLTVNGVAWRYLLAIPIMINSHYYFMEGSKLRPFAGGHIGVIYTNQELKFTAIEQGENNWNFGFAPEAGALWSISDGLGLRFGLRYNFAFYSPQQFDMGNLGFLSLNAGILFR
ncbi:MAG: outer membrane beta-barrel protein [Cyclobacteriaceae bacterium]|nr:outer membrane beta-barrel protein [Cyclobacteriaceae bacterium]